MEKIEDSLHAVTHQNSRLKAELRDLQHERDFFKHDVVALIKQLQNVGDKVGRSRIPATFTSTFLEAFLNFTFDSAEPCFGEGLALRRSAEPEQEALQGRAVSAGGAGPAAAAAGERAAPGGGAPRQGRPPPVQRNGDNGLKDVPPALHLSV